MIIITADGKNNDIIAKILYNVELNKTIFNLDGTLNQNPQTMHTITHENITYTIRGNAGVVYGLPMLNDTYWKHIVIEMDKLDDINHCNISDTYESNTDFMQSTLTKKRLRYVLKKHKRTTNAFIWRIGVYDDIYIMLEPNKTVSQKIFTFNTMIDYNSVFIDNLRIFKTNSVMTLYNTIKYNHFTESDRFVTFRPIIISKQMGIHPYIQRLQPKPRSPGVGYGMSKNDFTPIYEKDWKHINPVGVSDIQYLILHFKDVLLHPELYNGGVTDVCHACRSYLYDDIYAVCHMDKHMCICAVCFHNGAHIDNMTWFKTRYPRTVLEVLDMLTLTDDLRQLIIEHLTESIITPHFHGYLTPMPILLKHIMPPKGKKLFVYTEI